MEKSLWNRAFTSSGCPPWPCPVCQKGVLTLMPDLFREQTTKDSMRDSNEDWWGFEHVVLSFSAWAECSNKKCEEQFTISGRGYVDQVPTDEHMQDYEYVNFFVPHHVFPTLHLCSLPEDCSEEIAKPMKAAFALYWQNKPASAGRIRVALERLLDHLGVPSKTAAGKSIALGQRIEVFSKTDPVQGGHLMALKWLGNVGSHTAEVETNDLLDAFEVIEHVLAELIGKRSAEVAKLAAQLTAKYGR